jgi:signal transduction histidine kinase
LERDGLAAAIRDYAAQHADEGGARVTVEDRLPFEAPPHVRVTAFQVVREALTNARKHARAAEVEVVLEAHDRGLRVTVRDDGDGFEPSTAAWKPGHLGLGSMRDRAELAGGSLDIRSAPGEGTSVVFWLPVDRA